MSDQEKYRRRSARVVLLDEHNRVLLLKFRVDPDIPGAGHGWVTPGGGVEEGETPAEAAARELREETGLFVHPDTLGRRIAQTSGYGDVGWASSRFLDVFFHHRVVSHEVDISGQEAHELKYHAGHHWWTLDALTTSSDTIYPVGLAELVTALIAGGVPARPLQLPWHH